MNHIHKHISREYIGYKCKSTVKLNQIVEKKSVIAKSFDGKQQVFSHVKGKVIRIYPNEIFIEYTITEQNNQNENKLKINEDKTPVDNNKNNQPDYNTKISKNKINNETVSNSKTNYGKTKKLDNNIDNTFNKTQKIENNNIKNKQTIIDSQNNKFKVKSLDGLRTFAVLAVILYHLKSNILPGGLVGVTVFFVLSGYLITGILLEEIHYTGKINIKQFWLRRIRRLFPAIICVIILTCFVCLAFNRILLTKMKPDILPSLCWMQNWWYIVRDLSYFDNLGDPSPLVHFWSLAIEEQFYLVWPLLLLAAYKLKLKDNIIKKTCLILAIISALLMMIIYNPDQDPTRVYYGTDTRAFSLFIGAFLAFIWPWQNIHKNTKKLNTKQIKCLDYAGLISIFFLIVIMIFISGLSSLMYYGILFISSILSAIIIASLIIPETKISKILSWNPLVWIGQRSYGMYLWHLPIILFINMFISDDSLIIINNIVAIVLIIAISSLQYKFIEKPMRCGLISNKFHEIRKRNFKLKHKELIAIIISCTIVIICTFFVLTSQDEYIVPEEEIVNNDEDIVNALQKDGKFYPTLIADSITGAIKMWNFFPYSINDSEVGRSTKKGITKLKEYTTNNQIDKVVVCAFFNNNKVTSKELQEIVDTVGSDKNVFLVNTYTIQEITSYNNSMLKNFADDHENVFIIDWYSAVSQSPGKYLYKDKTHINKEGQILYINTIANAINSFLPENTRCDISKIPENINKNS